MKEEWVFLLLFFFGNNVSPFIFQMSSGVYGLGFWRSLCPLLPLASDTGSMKENLLILLLSSIPWHVLQN
jgi:hypothetical protein